MSIIKKILEIIEKYPTVVKYLGITILAILLVLLAVITTQSFVVAKYKRTIGELKVQLIQVNAEKKVSLAKQRLLEKQLRLKELELSNKQRAKERERLRRQIEEDKRKLKKEESKLDNRIRTYDDKTMDDLIKRANQLIGVENEKPTSPDGATTPDAGPSDGPVQDSSLPDKKREQVGCG